MYRAFFALPFLSNSAGLPTHAVYGFAKMLAKVLREHRPDYVAVVFDAPGSTFRHELYEEYKANRPGMPDDLVPQVPYIKKLVEALNVTTLEQEGFEADDLIGTVTRMAEGEADVTIVTGDKDMVQLVGEHVTILDTMKDRSLDREGVVRKYGVEPSQAVEMFGLMGDSSDNVPGVPGVGEKTAVKLIKEFGSIASLLERVEAVSNARLRENLKKYRDQALMSRELVVLNTEVPLKTDWKDFGVTESDEEKLKELFKELEFTKLLKEISPKREQLHKDCYLVVTEEECKTLVARLEGAGECALNVETTSSHPMDGEIAGVALAFEPRQAYYIPFAHEASEGVGQLDRMWVLEQLKHLMENPKIRKVGHDLKHAYIVLKRNGVALEGIHGDTMVASYVLNPSRHNHRLDDVALEYLNHQMITFKEAQEKGRGDAAFHLVDAEKAKTYACESADVTFLLAQNLFPRLKKEGFAELFHEIEMPLLKVLAEMEMNGVKVDGGMLEGLSREFEELLSASMEKIYELAGEDFNINSPQQLGKILFEKLKLRSVKKTKTGYSTDIEVLNALSSSHPLPAEVVAYRSLSKLKSTYVDALPQMIHPETGRIHTSYNQTVTATGRLSSSDPNLQNIPIRTPEGRRIRESFVAEPGWGILSADYSQVELRILAHLSHDETLIGAFKQGEDIHTRTAAEIFGLMPELVTAEMRREAKVINFGIIYGMSSFGLARQLGVSPKVAKAYITDYFQKYQGVRAYVDSVLEEAHEKGFVSTVMNRRRYLPEITGANVRARQFAERTAVNTPIQGTAADIIKVAMVKIARQLGRRRLKTKMIVQVHDELVFEVPEGEVEAVKDLVRREMEGVIELSVPLKVDVSWGNNWSEAH
jgi:DNA polymerase-1